MAANLKAAHEVTQVRIIFIVCKHLIIFILKNLKDKYSTYKYVCGDTTNLFNDNDQNKENSKKPMT